ncbi:MAG: hypothetical protein ABJJ26_19340 [Algoriphagus sp.]
MLNLRIEERFGHRSSNQLSKEYKVTGIIADNHQIKYRQVVTSLDLM